MVPGVCDGIDRGAVPGLDYHHVVSGICSIVATILWNVCFVHFGLDIRIGVCAELFSPGLGAHSDRSYFWALHSTCAHAIFTNSNKRNPCLSFLDLPTLYTVVLRLLSFLPAPFGPLSAWPAAPRPLRWKDPAQRWSLSWPRCVWLGNPASHLARHSGSKPLSSCASFYPSTGLGPAPPAALVCLPLLLVAISVDGSCHFGELSLR